MEPIYLERGTDNYGINPAGPNPEYGLFFLQTETNDILDLISTQKNTYNDYGRVTIYKLSPKARIYHILDRIEGILKNRLWGYKSNILYNLTGHKFKTLYDIIKYLYKIRDWELDDEDFYNDEAIELIDCLGDSDNPGYYYLQDVLMEYLSKKNYDGIHYFEDDINLPNEYQIWNLDCVIPLKISGNNLVPISWSDKKLRLAIDHCFKWTHELDFLSLEDDIINLLHLNPQELEDLSLSELDSYIWVYIKDLLDNKSFNVSEPNKLDVVKDLLNPEVKKYSSKDILGDSENISHINYYLELKLNECKDSLTKVNNIVSDAIDVLKLSVNSDFKTKENSKQLNDLYLIKKSVKQLLDLINL